MPCRDPEATPDQEHTRLTFELLSHVKTKLKLKHDLRAIGKAAGDYAVLSLTKADADYATAELCRVLSGVQTGDPTGFERLVYDAHDRASRQLADWWERHQEYDRARERAGE